MAQTFFPITPTEIVAGAANDWVTMDASGYVPSGATGVILHCINKQSTGRALGLRKNGSTDDRTDDIAGLGHCWAAIGVDANRVFEAYVTSTEIEDIYVVGYTISGVTFKTNADDMSLGVTGSWQPINCSTEAPNAIGLIFEIIGGLWKESGLRKNGSSDDRHPYVRDHRWFTAIIGCDDSQICEGYIGDTDVDFFLVGYITDGCTFNTNATDISLGSTEEWLDLSALPAGANMGFIEVISTATYNFGLRKNDTAEDIYRDVSRHVWGIVECDASQIIEGKIENTGVDFFVVGYSEVVAPPAYKDIATRFKLWARNFKDIASRFKLWVRNYLDAATRFVLTAQSYKDIATRFRLTVRAYKDIATRFRLGLPYYKDIATRFKLIVQGYKDIATRFALSILNYKDVSTRFRLFVQAYQDAATRFRLGLPYYTDVATRFKLFAQNYKDISTRFKLTVGALAYKDIPSRFKLWVQGYTDVATRFKLFVKNYKDIATRFRLTVQSYIDISARFRLLVQNYTDIATRFRLVVQNYQDVATRFRLIKYYFKDVSARFRLAPPSAYSDIGIRFFLYVPTWKELELQKEVTELELAIEPKAHFSI